MTDEEKDKEIAHLRSRLLDWQDLAETWKRLYHNAMTDLAFQRGVISQLHQHR